MRLDAAMLPERLDRDGLSARTVLVVDVLRASTTMIAALGNGCGAIVPVADPDEAHRRARELGGLALVAGERGGRMVNGFDLGNSPLDVTADRVGGKTLIFTTSNGTRALLAAREAAAVGVAGLVNLSAAVSWAHAGGRDVTVLCSGDRGRLSLEDNVCAGLLIDGLLTREPGSDLTDAAREVLTIGRGYGPALARLAQESTWARHLALAGGAADVAACLALDTSALVPVWLPAIDKIVAGSR